jgi:gas vesicle protein
MNEARKGFNARHKNKVASIEPSKPRNFVAKNAINTGAGAHKDKKKAMKQGDTKHKKDYAEGMEEKFQAQLDELNQITEKWTQKYKSSINCSHPKGFSQKAHCAGKKKHNEDMTMEAVCPDCGMCQTHGDLNEIKKGAKDSNGYSSCWKGYHAAGTKKGKNGGRVRNCVPNEGVAEGGYSHGFADPSAPSLGRRSRDHDSGDDEPQGMFMVMIDGRPWKEFTSNMAFQRAKSIATKYPDKKVQVRWPTGQLNTVAEQGVAEGIKGAIAGGAAGALLTRTPSGAMTGADIGNTLGDMTDENYDEAETMKNSLHTIIRMATELDKHIDDSSEFDEWVSEKMGAVKGMLTAVTDYVISDQEMGSHEEETDEEIAPGIVHQHQHGTLKHTSTAMEGAKVDRQAKHITKSMMKSHPGMSKDNAESAAWAHIKHPKKKKKVKEDAYNIYLEVLLNKSLNK